MLDTDNGGMEAAVPASRAAKNFGELLARVVRGERVVITRAGHPVAVVGRWEPPAQSLQTPPRGGAA